MTYLDRILPLWEMHLPLLLLLCHSRRLALCQSPPNRSRLLRTQIQWQVLLILVVDPQLFPLVGIDDSEHAGNGFSEVVARLAMLAGELSVT